MRGKFSKAFIKINLSEPKELIHYKEFIGYCINEKQNRLFSQQNKNRYKNEKRLF